MQRVAHRVTRLSLDGVAVFVLQVLAASVVDGVVVRCRGGDPQYGVGDEGVRGRHRIGAARGEINGVRKPRIGSDIGVELAHPVRSEEHTSELQSRVDLVCRLLLEKKKKKKCKIQRNR